MAQKTPTLDDVVAEIDLWFAATIQAPPIAHSVDCYNQAQAARGDLKVRLAALFLGEEPIAPAADPIAADAATKVDDKA